jgi:hypothetical protein
MKILLGDFSAEVGTEDILELVIRVYMKLVMTVELE